VTADVTVQRIPVLLDAAVRAFDNGPAVDLGHGDVDELSSVQYRLRWTVTIQLRDVAAFRRIALDVCPAEDTATRTKIEASLAAAWQQAAPPFAPLQRIPWITWSPIEAMVAHVPAR